MTELLKIDQRFHVGLMYYLSDLTFNLSTTSWNVGDCLAQTFRNSQCLAGMLIVRLHPKLKSQAKMLPVLLGSHS